MSGAREKQVRDVRARDEEHQCDGAKHGVEQRVDLRSENCADIRLGDGANARVSNCLENQALTRTSSTIGAIQRVCVRTITLRMVSSFRMHATRASFFGLPAATSRR